MLWWESDSGELSIRYNDGDSEQWVSATGGATDPSKVAKTGDTMSGDLSIKKAQPAIWLNKNVSGEQSSASGADERQERVGRCTGRR